MYFRVIARQSGDIFIGTQCIIVPQRHILKLTGTCQSVQLDVMSKATGGKEERAGR